MINELIIQIPAITAREKVRIVVIFFSPRAQYGLDTARLIEQ